MAVKEVIKMGHPLLFRTAKSVAEFDTPELHQLLKDMKDTMDDLNGAGLAAPQIAVSVRVMLFGVTENDRYPDVEPVPETILINPEYSVIDSGKESDWEGCLSVPHMRGLVPRYKGIKYWGYDVKGELIEREAHGFHARVFQHEFDHLNGVLYPQRIENMKNFGFDDVLFLHEHHTEQDI